MDEQERVCSAYREGCKAEMEAKLDKLCEKQQAFEKLVDERKRMTEQALSLAHDILDKRMIAENNVREEMRERSISFRTDFLSKNEYNARHEALLTKIETLEKQTSKIDGRMVAIVFIIPLAISMVMMLILHLLSR